MYLANQVYPEVIVSLYNVYQDVTLEFHGYIILDLSQDMNHGLRFRTNVFPTKNIPSPSTLI